MIQKLKNLPQKIKAFQYVFYKSLTSLPYYNDIIKTNLKFSIKYFLAFAVLVSFVSAIIVSVRTSYDSDGPTSTVAQVVNELEDIYPEDLVITIKDGTLSTNKNVDITIKMLESLSQSSPLPKYLIVFDSDGTINDFEKYDTVALVNEKNILINDNGKIETYPISNFPNGTLDKTKYSTQINELRGLVQYLPILVTLAVFVGLLLVNIIYRLVYIFVIATALFIIGKSSKSTLKFSKFYQIGLHLVTLPMLLEVALLIFDVTLPIPAWFFAVSIGFGIVIISRLDKKVNSK